MLVAKNIPVRSCVGCGARRPQPELLRLFVTLDGTVDADPGRRHGGRGAYLCWKVECLWEALRKNRFSRALRRPLGGLDDAALGARFSDRVREHLLRRLHTARRANAALPRSAVETPPAEVKLLVVADGHTPPPGEAPVVRAGPRELLALALQAPEATYAAVVSDTLAREIAALAQARVDFLRTPPPRARGRAASPRENEGTGGLPPAGGGGRGPSAAAVATGA